MPRHVLVGSNGRVKVEANGWANYSLGCLVLTVWYFRSSLRGGWEDRWNFGGKYGGKIPFMNERNWRYTASDLPSLAPFGSVLADRMSIAYAGKPGEGSWTQPELVDLDSFRLHPGAHCLHYGSSCFEGLKAYRGKDDSVVVFRLDMHARRFETSAQILRMPAPDPALFEEMVLLAAAAAADWVPPGPGSLYLRPTLLGTDPDIGAASRPSQMATFFVMASPVGDYFAASTKGLRLLVEDQVPRTTPQFGRVKTGANYAAALGITLQAGSQWQADQILFCPDGDVQETGASNFLLIDDSTILTKPLADSFLHGVTRDSLLTLASELGYETQERDFTVEELLEWTRHGEAALSGTAAVLTGVGTLIHHGKEYGLSGGMMGPNTRRLRQALVDIQQSTASDAHGWLTTVDESAMS